MLNAGHEREHDLKGQRLRVVVNHPEWKEFEALCEEIYEENMRKLLESENPEARGAVKAVKEIFFRVNREIKFGEACRLKIFQGLANLKDVKPTSVNGLPS